METQFLSGLPIAEKILSEVKKEVAELRSKGIYPGLGTILVGEDSASAGYIRKKHETCKELGIKSFNISVPSTATQAELLSAVKEFNENDEVDAYLIQNPVPKGFDFNKAVEAMSPDKDADGLHPSNLGRLVLQQDGPVPCTPAGIIEILKFYNISIQGKHVVVVGRGPTLGRPLALLLSMKRDYANAAVTVVHTGVKNLADYTREADILVSAVGVPSFIMPDMVKPGAVVVSGGIQWEGRKLLPDVDVSVASITSWITPRLGGVGPTTVALLLRNTVQAAKRKLK
ncbi:MAG: bifunctional 5,10-methylene-tetrahydrofolate dehydrogenase/5,10-methylene-tetrahydrofolate cyclohydrolase [Spirochaetales bacterium]|nr:bifunctional 5,10-methylene-tetrahydrofolate dehydrogenase/5,10-methylene-tetrahydrofolate cyclohydrolase [Spirochaetales bacterium]